MENVSEIDTGTKDHDTVLELIGGLNSFMVRKSVIYIVILVLLLEKCQDVKHIFFALK